MDHSDILITFAGGLAGALVLGYIALRLKLSPIIGYLLAGVMVGPFTPGIVVDRGVAEQFAEIGVILLMFGIGIRFHLHELLAVWRVAVPGALIQSTLSTVALAGMLHLMGLDWKTGLILGMAVSVASTVVMSLVLAERNDLHGKIGHIAIGWTVVEDLLTVALLILLPVVFSQEPGSGQGLGLALGVAGLKIAGLAVAMTALARWFIPWAMTRVAMTRSRELFTLSVLVLAVGIAVGSATLFGVSMALGAFLAGLAVSRTDFASRAANDALPMRDAFAVLFFVSVGLLLDPKSLLQAPLITVAVLAVILAVKPLAALLTVRLLGQPFHVAVPVGAAFSQIGEFSFILGSVARGLGLLDDAGWNALVIAAIISIAVNPYLYRWARRKAIPGADRPAPSAAASAAAEPVDPDRCVLVGYGPVGKIVHKLLTSRRAKITVIDLNLDTIRKLSQAGHAALYGNILQPGTLIEAGIETAGSLILSADVDQAPEIIKQARRLNPELRVLARCTYLRDAPSLYSAGANTVVVGEAEVGVALAEVVTAADQLAGGEAAEEREAIRRSLYESSGR